MIISTNLIIFTIISFLLIFGTEVIKRKLFIPVYLTRKIAHFGGASIGLLMPLFLNQKQIILICIIFALILATTKRTQIFSSIQGVKRATLGEVFLPLGVALCALFFIPENIKSFQFGVLIMGVSDGLAGLIGERFGRNPFRILGIKKTIEGTLIFFVTSLALSLYFASSFEYIILAVPLILTASEFFLIYGVDNLVLPILGAFLIGLK